ncbi:ImmA/IrrE family metallo-endopeptidase [uncultured Veillonella sp.]|uniref:ImmA/IrrE family metallo-endopeptidase n=1 Tax=uncultured Veillonella sp. TaxID=159268 RepID=UPI002805402E|nr:ImmA/IrrE family metallo-endopeptidase [uncultured Veillonella sp.]
MILLIINLIYCDLPNAKAVSEESEDIDTHNIYINKNLPHERMREEIKHELSHIIHDDFYVDHHVNLVERMVRLSQLEDGDLNGIDFYHHII